MSKIFGGSKSKQKSNSVSSSNSYNQAYQPISQAFLPGGQSAYNAGMQGYDEALGGGFEGYKEKSGFDFLKELGMKGIMGQFGGGGVFQSGAAGKALQSYGANLQSTFLDKYLAQQGARAGLGVNAGQLVGGTGGVSNSRGNSTSTGGSSNNPGMGGFIGGLLSSERRLKTKIEKLGELEDGLGIYSYEYKKQPGVMYIGTMVEEVEALRPWALGPITEEGERTVDYNKLSEGGNE